MLSIEPSLSVIHIFIDNLGAVTLAWAAARGFTASLMHGLCTMIVGTGITYVKKQKKLFYTGTFGLLSIAVTLHALFNLLIQSQYDYIGMVFPLALYGFCLLYTSAPEIPEFPHLRGFQARPHQFLILA